MALLVADRVEATLQREGDKVNEEQARDNHRVDSKEEDRRMEVRGSHVNKRRLVPLVRCVNPVVSSVRPPLPHVLNPDVSHVKQLDVETSVFLPLLHRLNPCSCIKMRRASRSSSPLPSSNSPVRQRHRSSPRHHPHRRRQLHHCSEQRIEQRINNSNNKVVVEGRDRVDNNSSSVVEEDEEEGEVDEWAGIKQWNAAFPLSPSALHYQHDA